jgi:hypothetical protein
VHLACRGQAVEIDPPPSAEAMEREAETIARLRERLIELTREKYGENALMPVLNLFDAVPDTLEAKRFAASQYFPELREEFSTSD